MNLVVIVNDIDGRFKVVESDSPKGTPFGDSDCLFEAVVGALSLCDEDTIIKNSHYCGKCDNCVLEHDLGSH